MTDLKKYTNIAGTVAVSVIFVYMLVRPSAVTEEASKALTFCLAVIIPSLFVNMALIAYLFPRIVNAMGGRHTAAAALIGGMLCGFPAGADLAVRLRENGASQEYADYINSFSNNASISFVISFAGVGVLKSLKLGIILVALELLSSVVCLIVMKWILKPDCSSRLPHQDEISFPSALRGAVKSMAGICGSIVVFSCISSAASLIVPESSRLYVAVKGILEFSGGINQATTLSPPANFIFTAIFIGWSGICVLMQIKTVVLSKIRIKYYLLAKLIQSVAMAGGAVLLSKYLC